MLQRIAHIGKILLSGVAIAFTLSLFWCLDTECLEGGSDKDCAALICLMLSHHDEPVHDSGDSHHECACVCHTPVSPLISYYSTPEFPNYVTQFFSSPQFQLVSLAGNTLYRPPIA